MNKALQRSLWFLLVATGCTIGGETTGSSAQASASAPSSSSSAAVSASASTMAATSSATAATTSASASAASNSVATSSSSNTPSSSANAAADSSSSSTASSSSSSSATSSSANATSSSSSGGATGFAGFWAEWQVPSGGWQDQGFIRTSAPVVESGDQEWTTLDITGDGRADLVVTGVWSGASFTVFDHDVDPHWRVYAGTDNGFQSFYVEWPVPDGGWNDQGFVRLSGQALGLGEVDWNTLDLNGDGLPDLVVTGRWDSSAYAVLGHDSSPHWDVYLGTATGFAGFPTSWPVPDGGWAGQGFLRTGARSVASGDEEWGTADINADGRPDLVVTGRWTDNAIVVLGHDDDPHWRVHLNTGDGFASATTWPVPDGGWDNPYGGGFTRLAAQAARQGDQEWSTLDLDGDGYLDLVVTGAWIGDAMTVFDHGSDPHWRVYRGTATGFEGLAMTWDLPSGGWTDAGFAQTDAPALELGDDEWTTMDLTADGLPDLVVTARWDSNGWAVLGHDDNDDHWNVYTGTPTGFTGFPVTWSLPSGGRADSGFARAAATASGIGDEEWATLDLDGDGLLDLVVTSRWASQDDYRVFADSSGDQWRVYRGVR